jgi:hypothetical protein
MTKRKLRIDLEATVAGLAHVAQFVKEFHELSNERHEFTVKRCVSLEARMVELEQLVQSMRWDATEPGEKPIPRVTDELLRARGEAKSYSEAYSLIRTALERVSAERDALQAQVNGHGPIRIKDPT